MNMNMKLEYSLFFHHCLQAPLFTEVFRQVEGMLQSVKLLMHKLYIQHSIVNYNLCMSNFTCNV